MFDRNFLRSVLAWESRAYGFTIAFWGSGAMLIKAHGLPVLSEALAYGGGAVIGFALLAAVTYQATLSKVDYKEPDHLVLSMAHYLAALLPMVMAHYIAKLQQGILAFFLTGVAVILTYNLSMFVEKILSEEAKILENRLFKYLG